MKKDRLNATKLYFDDNDFGSEEIGFNSVRQTTEHDRTAVLNSQQKPEDGSGSVD